MTWNERLLTFFKIKGVNNRDVANKIASNEGLVSRWTKAEVPSMTYMMKLIKVFPDIDLNYILKDNIEKNEEYQFLEIINSVDDKKSSYHLDNEMILIDEIEERLSLLKKKMAQNSHK